MNPAVFALAATFSITGPALDHCVIEEDEEKEERDGVRRDVARTEGVAQAAPRATQEGHQDKEEKKADEKKADEKKDEKPEKPDPDKPQPEPTPSK